MIELSDPRGHVLYLAPAAIAQVGEAGASARWHGIMAWVRTFDGRTLEVRENAALIAQRVREASCPAPRAAA